MELSDNSQWEHGAHVQNYGDAKFDEDGLFTVFSKLVVEFIGTFVLVLTVSLVPLSSSFGPLAVGSSLMVMVFAGGHVSGGHFNPAVSLGVCLRQRLHVVAGLFYWLVQLGGGVCAGLLGYYLLGSDVYQEAIPQPGVGYSNLQAVVAEGVYTFALVFVVLNVTTTKYQDSNSFFGLAIGFTVAAGAFSVGPISGGVFNPAVALGISSIGRFYNLCNMNDIWIYIVGPLGGGVVAAVVFYIINFREFKQDGTHTAYERV